jgi:hypothetical protein
MIGYVMPRVYGAAAVLAMFFGSVTPVEASGSTTSTISSVAGDYNSGMLVKLAGVFSNPDNCGRTDWYILPDNHPHSQLLQAILLSAQASNRSVGFQLDGCLDNFPRIIAAWN